jgi:hypothetical protein
VGWVFKIFIFYLEEAIVEAVHLDIRHEVGAEEDAVRKAQRKLRIGTHGIPHKFASFEVPQVVNDFRMMLRLTVYDSVERLQLVIGRKDGINVARFRLGSLT